MGHGGLQPWLWTRSRLRVNILGPRGEVIDSESPCATRCGAERGIIWLGRSQKKTESWQAVGHASDRKEGVSQERRKQLRTFLACERASGRACPGRWSLPRPRGVIEPLMVDNCPRGPGYTAADCAGGYLGRRKLAGTEKPRARCAKADGGERGRQVALGRGKGAATTGLRTDLAYAAVGMWNFLRSPWARCSNCTG